MAMITPASDVFPAMIPPCDYPPEDAPYKPARREMEGGRNNRLISIEVSELNVLTAFLAAFASYLRDRHNPDKSAEVMRRYRQVLRFYDGASIYERPTKKR